MAIGESLVPASAMLFWILGQKHDLPEVRTLAHLESVTRNIAPSSGVKRGFGYAYHREGQRSLQPDESSLFIGPTQPIFRESQFFRQDIDHYLVKAAQRHGVKYRDATAVTGVDIDRSRAVLGFDDGASLTARFVVDATGRNSVLAKAFDLREEPCRLRHHSRTIFSHFTGIRPLEEVEPGAEGAKVSASWSKGTLHHVFDGGWFWVIPFDNHPGSTSNLVSVGLTVDPRRHPRPDGVEPAKEFASFVERFPVVERHLGPAQAARPFVGTDRIQFSSTTAIGNRFLLLPHAYGFVDPLFSRGIWRSLEAVDVIADELLAALDEDELSADRFAAVDAMQAAMLDDNDQMVFNAFRAMADYDTWTAWLRIWLADELATTLPMLAATFRCVAEGDETVFGRLVGLRRPGTGFSFSSPLQALIDAAESDLDEVEAGTLTAADARVRICDRLDRAEFLPDNLMNWRRPDRFGMDLTPPNLVRLLWWGRRHAPHGVRDAMFDFSLRSLLRLQVQDAVAPWTVKRDTIGNVVPQRNLVG
jgi:FADH2 O2-dependent halogenase